MNENQLVTRKPNELAVFNPEQIELIKNTVCKGASDDELKLFLYVCNKTGLDPLTRQIYAIKKYDTSTKKDTLSFQTGIDGIRLTAERTGKYMGQDGPFWCDEDGVWLDVWNKDKYPYAARVGVYKKGFDKAIYAIAKWSSFRKMVYSTKEQKHVIGHTWQQMPDHMLAKCAESGALRKAFPQELSDLYIHEEMDQAENPKPAMPPADNPPDPCPGKKDSDPVTIKELKALTNIMESSKIEPSHLIAYCETQFGKTKSKDLTIGEFRKLIHDVPHIMTGSFFDGPL